MAKVTYAVQKIELDGTAIAFTATNSGAVVLHDRLASVPRFQ